MPSERQYTCRCKGNTIQIIAIFNRIPFFLQEIMIVIYDDATYTVFNAILEKSAAVNLEYMGEDDNEGSYPQPMQQNRLAYVKRIGNN